MKHSRAREELDSGRKWIKYRVNEAGSAARNKKLGLEKKKEQKPISAGKELKHVSISNQEKYEERWCLRRIEKDDCMIHA